MCSIILLIHVALKSVIELTGTKQKFHARIARLKDALPFPLNLLLDVVLPAQTQHRGRAPEPPKCIGIVLAEPSAGHLPLSKVANIIAWSAQNGLEHISVYDPTGESASLHSPH